MKVILDIDPVQVRALITLRIKGLEELPEIIERYDTASHRLFTDMEKLLSMSRYFEKHGMTEDIDNKLNMFINVCDNIQSKEACEFFWRVEDVKTLSSLGNALQCCEFMLGYGELKRESMISQLVSSINYIHSRLLVVFK